MKRFATSAILLLSLTVNVSAVRADDKQEAIKHFEAGFSLMEKRDFKAASAEFELSVKLYANANNLYNLAGSYRGEKRFEEALDAFNRILAEFNDKIDEELRADVQNQIAMIEKYVSKLNLETLPTGAALRVNGRDVGVSPLKAPLIMSPGDHTIEASLLGYETGKQQVNLSSGEVKKIVVPLAPQKSTLTIDAPQSGATVALNGKPVGLTPIKIELFLDAGIHYISMNKEGFEPIEQAVELKVGEDKTVQLTLKPVSKAVDAAKSTSKEQAENRNKKKSRLKPVAWALVGATAGLACASGALWGVTSAKWDDRESKVVEIDSNMGEWDFSDPADDAAEKELRGEIDELRSQISNLNKAAVAVSIATGAAAAATVAVWMLVRKGNKESKPQAVFVGPGGLQVSF